MVAAWCRAHAALVAVRKLWLYDNRVGDAGASALADLMSTDMLEVTAMKPVLSHNWVATFSAASAHQVVALPSCMLGASEGILCHLSCWLDASIGLQRSVRRALTLDLLPVAGAPIAQQHQRRRHGRHHGRHPSAAASRVLIAVAGSATLLTGAAVRSYGRAAEASPSEAPVAAVGVESH